MQLDLESLFEGDMGVYLMWQRYILGDFYCWVFQIISFCLTLSVPLSPSLLLFLS